MRSNPRPRGLYSEAEVDNTPRHSYSDLGFTSLDNNNNNNNNKKVPASPARPTTFCGGDGCGGGGDGCEGEVRRREAKGRRMSVGMGVYLVHYMYYMEARKLHIKVDPAL